MFFKGFAYVFKANPYVLEQKALNLDFKVLFSFYIGKLKMADPWDSPASRKAAGRPTASWLADRKPAAGRQAGSVASGKTWTPESQGSAILVFF